MKRYRVQALCLLLAAALALTGMRRPPGEEDTGKLQVVCTLFPYYDFVRAIGGDRVEPYLLVTAGREAHSFEPTPLDVIRISQADVFICNGGESETWVDDILDAARGEHRLRGAHDGPRPRPGGGVLRGHAGRSRSRRTRP